MIEEKVKRGLNKILSDFGNAYEKIPDDMGDLSAQKLKIAFESALEEISQLFEQEKAEIFREIIGWLTSKRYELIAKNETERNRDQQRRIRGKINIINEELDFLESLKSRFLKKEG